jgi:hypothetical protein
MSLDTVMGALQVGALAAWGALLSLLGWLWSWGWVAPVLLALVVVASLGRRLLRGRRLPKVRLRDLLAHRKKGPEGEDASGEEEPPAVETAEAPAAEDAAPAPQETAAAPAAEDGGDRPVIGRGTARDGDGRERRYTVVSWRPGATPPARPGDGPDAGAETDTATAPVAGGMRDRVAAAALWVAGAVVVAVIIGGAIVVYDAQYQFAYDHNGHNAASAAIQAAIPDLVWVAMAALGLSQALRGRSSLRATLSIAVFFGLSLAAQLLHGERTMEGYLVSAITPIALALMLEALMHGVRHWALARDGHEAPSTPLIARALRLLFAVVVMPWAWLLRLCLDRSGTWSGLRTWLLDMIPYAPGRTRAQDRAEGALEAAHSADAVRAQAEAWAQEQVEAAEERVRAAEAAAEEAERQAQERAREAESGAQAAVRAERDRLAGRITELEAAQRRHPQQVQEAVATEVERLQREHAARMRQVQEATDRDRRTADALRRELEELRRSLSGRQQMEMLYEGLGRSGDPRYGVWDAVDSVAEELAPQAGLESIGTARRYLRDYLAKTAAEGRAEAGDRVMIGGAR